MFDRMQSIVGRQHESIGQAVAGIKKVPGPRAALRGVDQEDG